MPELPEVEAARRLIERSCAGKRIASVIAVEGGGGPRTGLFDEIVMQGAVDEADVQEKLVGRTLKASCRHGKQMWWELSGAGPIPTWHFGMTGAFSVKEPDGEAASGSKYKRVVVDVSEWPPKFTKCEVVFDDGTRVAFTDPRRLGRVKFVTSVREEPPVSELGPDPFLGMMPLPDFASRLAERSLPIKALLLDQSFLAGIGNWIADEVLYHAAIHPETASNALDDDEVAALHERIVGVIKFACDVDADNGRFPPSWLFHVRWGKGKGKTTTRQGHGITFTTVGGRTSAVVSAIQGAPRKTKAEGSSAARSARRAAHIETVMACAAAPPVPDAPAAGDAAPAAKSRKRARGVEVSAEGAGAMPAASGVKSAGHHVPKVIPVHDDVAPSEASKKGGRARKAAAAEAAPSKAPVKRGRAPLAAAPEHAPAVPSVEAAAAGSKRRRSTRS